MFVRVKRSGSGKEKHEYLQIVESCRDGSRVRQRVIATLGRRDELVDSGRLDGLLTSLARFSTRLKVVEQVRRTGLQAHTTRSWGPALVFSRLWEEQGVGAILERLAAGRRFEFDVERATFAPALQRLCGVSRGSDLHGSRWPGSPGRVSAQGPHRPVRAQFGHTVPQRQGFATRQTECTICTAGSG